jgi:hypothetical protein
MEERLMDSEKNEPIRLLDVITGEVGQPRNDASPGSALYAVPFKLSKEPTDIWVRAFIHAWEFPERFTSMHRPGIARVEGNKIILDGTTIEEVEKYHLETLKLAIKRANETVVQETARRGQLEAAAEERHRQHLQHVESVAKRLKLGS